MNPVSEPEYESIDFVDWRKRKHNGNAKAKAKTKAKKHDRCYQLNSRTGVKSDVLIDSFRNTVARNRQLHQGCVEENPRLARTSWIQTRRSSVLD
mmetsp:Transcript_28613/g.77488  ORF Transcript_28613/g.77488 Transcript_28613/m.77488 type:complete len:95 (-) Transcript_28613:150-434(-)